MAVSWRYRRQTLPAEHLPISPLQRSAVVLLWEDTTLQLAVVSKIRSGAEAPGAETQAGILSPRRTSDRTWLGRQSNCASGWDQTRLEPRPAFRDGTLTESQSPMAPVRPWP